MTTTFSQPIQTNLTLPKSAGWPLIGALPVLMRDPLHYVIQAHADYGDIYQLDLGVTRIIMLNHPRHAQHVLVDHAHNYTKGGPIWASIRTLLGNGLPVSEGDFWRRQRRMMQPHFHRQRLAAITDQMISAIDEGIATWPKQVPPEQPFDMMAAMSAITMRVIVRALFGTSISLAATARVSQELTFVLNQLLQEVVTQKLPAWLPIPGRRRYQQAVQAIDEVVFGVIERCQQENENGGQDNLIAMLLQMVDAETGTQMTAQQLRDEAVTMFLAGFETTATTLAWALHFLTQEPALMARLQAEIDQVVGDRLPTFADLPRLAYTRMVLQEAMRYYAPSWQLTRTAVAADEIDGYPIPAGSVVAVMQHVIHHHPAIWAQPERFDPERFTPEQEQQRPKQAWLPFGAGQRFCIGRDMALMEGQLVLTRLLQQYAIHAVPGRVAMPHAAMTLRPKNGVWVALAARIR